jgi:hypothetical protein
MSTVFVPFVPFPFVSRIEHSAPVFKQKPQGLKARFILLSSKICTNVLYKLGWILDG